MKLLATNVSKEQPKNPEKMPKDEQKKPKQNQK